MRTKNLLIVLLTAGLSAATLSGGPAHALTLRGQVLDGVTGNPLPDADVTVVGHTDIEPVSTETLPGRHRGGTTDLAGRFSIEVGGVAGIYTLSVSHIGYREAKVEAEADGESIRVELTPEPIRLSEVVVGPGRGIPGRTPGALSNLDRNLVELSYGAQDVPLLVNEIPSVTAFSWSGSDVGAAELRIRGFGQERIVATVNGVPINDPEDHCIYWQDTPDFLTNTYDIQIERGVSSFQSGPAGIGGGVNLVTSDAVSRRELGFTLQSGSFNTTRRTLFYRSGVVGQRYNFTGRYSRVTTDGYRDHTGADVWSYFLAAARFDPDMVTRLQVYGGQEEMDAYWWGIDKSTLEKNRKANYSAWYKDYHEEYFWDPSVDYDGERDYFQQPHYMLHNQWRLSPELELNQSLFWIQGEGFYEEWKLNRKFSEYNLTPFDKIIDEDGDGVLDTVTIYRTDLIRRKHVTKDQVGWLTGLSWEVTRRTTLGFGLDLRNYESDHWGKVMWARELPGVVDPQHEWYRWEGDKRYLGGYVNLEHDLTDRLRLNGGLQLRQVTYDVCQEQMGAFPGYEYDLDWLFVNPRLGMSYQFAPETDIYASIAGAGREPVDEQIYDADNPDDIPRVSRFGPDEIDPERMWDVEVGARRQMGKASLGINLYGMFFTDEIVTLGFSSERDEEVYDNAPASRHIGIELDGNVKDLAPGLTLSGNLSYGQATLGDYEIDHVAGVDEDWNPIVETVNLEGNRIALFPDIIANMRATYTYDIVTASMHVQYVGKQFMDNREDDEAALDPYTVVDGVLRLRIDQGLDWSADFEIRGMNLTDEEYEPFGVVDVEYGTPYYIPAAGRRYLAGITVRL